jgi:glycosyltransferase involved in cell wall biosynthesis
VETNKPLTFLVFATEWESGHGGLSTFNRELCAALASLDHHVYCALPRASQEERDDATRRSVSLVTPAHPELHPENDTNLARPLEGVSHNVDYLVGHGRITGRPAVSQLKDHYRSAKYVHFVHMDPGSIEPLKGQFEKKEERINAERVLAQHACVVAAVGPELFTRYSEHLRPQRTPVVEFMPGLFLPMENREPSQTLAPSFLVLGRAEDIHLKGINLAIEAVSSWAKTYRDEHERFTLMIRGAPEAKLQELQDELNETLLSSQVRVDVRAFSPRENVIRNDLVSADLLLMLSREEAFGLVGLEAISLGVPVLLSSASGLAQAIGRQRLDSAFNWCVDVKSKVEIIARKIENIVGNLKQRRDEVRVLREAMHNSFSWANSAKTLVDHLRRPAPGSGGALAPYPKTLHEDSIRQDTFLLFKQASKPLLDWPQTLDDSDRWIERPELETLRSFINASDQRPMVVTGGPGSGKSALLARLAHEQVKAGALVFAIKADTLSNSVATDLELARALGLSGGFADAVDAAATYANVVVLIDQIDALTDVLAKHNGRLSVLLSFAEQAARIPTVRVVLSCRTYELEHDARIRRMKAIHLPLRPLDADAVRSCLPAGVTLTEDALDVLRSPQWLNLYLRTRQQSSGITSTLEAYWNESFADNARLETSAKKLAALMSEREELWIPEVVALKVISYDDQRQLLLSGILIQREKIGFSHQTLFEFARVRAFLDADNRLVEFAREKEFGLATRPTIRAALSYLRHSDLKKYELELGGLFEAPDLRPHLRLMLVDWLGAQTNLRTAEKQWVKKLWTTNIRGWMVHQLRNNTEWFDVLEACLPELMTSVQGLDRGLALAMLLGALPNRTGRAIELVDRHWAKDVSARGYLSCFVSAEGLWNSALYPLTMQAISQLVDGETKIYPYASVGHVISIVLKADAAASVRLCEVYCNALLRYEPSDHGEKNVQAVSRNYFESENEHWFVVDIARQAPHEFMDLVWPKLRSMLEKVSDEARIGYRPSVSINTVYPPDQDDGSGWMVAVREAAEQMLKRDETFLRKFVDVSKESESEVVHAVIVDLLRKDLPRSTQLAIDYLVEDQRRLLVRVSYRDDPSLSKELLWDLAQHANKIQLSSLWNAIRPLMVDARDDLTPELRLMVAQRESRLRSELTQALERGRPKDRKLTVRRKRGLQAVQSGMSAAQMLLAKDDDILQFLAPLTDSTEWNHPDRWLMGGSIEASRELAEAAKLDSERFLKLIRHLDKVHQRPIAYVLDALTEKLSVSEFEEHFHHFVDNGYFEDAERRSGMAWSIDKMCQKEVPSQRTLKLLHRWLSDAPDGPDATRDDSTKKEAHSRDGSVLFELDGFSALPEGNYPILRALARGLAKTRTAEATQDWLSILDLHLERKEHATVWIALLGTGFPLPADSIRRTMFVDRLFERFPTVRDTRHGVALALRSASYAEPNVVQRWCEQIRASPWHLGARAYGEMLLVLACSGHEWAKTQLDAQLKTPESSAVELEGIAFAAPFLFQENRALICRAVMRLVSVVSEKALKSLGRIFYNAGFLDEHIRSLLHALTPRWVFYLDPGRMTDFLTMLMAADEQLAADTLCSLVDSIPARKEHFWIDREFVDVAVTLQRAAKPSARNLALDAFEKLQEIGTFGVAEALESFDNKRRHVDVI